MVILGIDPGSITTGYAFLEQSGKGFKVLEYGTFHAPANRDLEDRLVHIVTELEALLDKYRPDALAMEGVFFAKNAKSALVLGHIRGAVLVACRKRGMSFNEYPPKVVKQSVTGEWNVGKCLAQWWPAFVTKVYWYCSTPSARVKWSRQRYAQT